MIDILQRYSTPYRGVFLPIDIEHVKEVYITYSQFDEVLFEKTLADCEILDSRHLRYRLSQEETSKFCEGVHDNSKVEIQATVITNSGQRIPSPIQKVAVEKALKEGKV